MDVDEWIRLCKKMAEWIAFVLQEAWSQEFVIVIEFLACQFSSALVEGSDVTLKHIDEVLGTVMQKHRAEHDFFINDPGLYRSQYPDGIIITLGDVRRPKLWIVDDNGTERSWFITHSLLQPSLTLSLFGAAAAAIVLAFFSAACAAERQRLSV